MKKILFGCFLLTVCTAFAEATVTDVKIKERWPWSHVVDIDYWLEATGSQDITMKVTFDGAPAGGVDVESGLVEGGLCAVPGLNHIAWDAAKAGYGSKKLANFKVLGTELTDASERAYLIMDLKEGSISYSPVPTPSDFFNADTYKQRYIVFRRIPAGTYQIGYTEAQLTTLNAKDAQKKGASTRVYTLSSDFYMAIHHLTSAQYENISSAYRDSNTSMADTQLAAYSIRGKLTNEAAKVRWPQDGHNVVDSSLVGKLRARMADAGLPAGSVIDLPTEVQWEIAARCGVTATFLSTGGTTIGDGSDTKQLLTEECPNESKDPVGVKRPNIWGLYDTLGHVYEMTLNTVELDEPATTSLANLEKVQNKFFDPAQKVDPVGVSGTDMSKVFMVTCNVGWSWSTSVEGLPTNRRCYRQTYIGTNGAEATNKLGVRFCVHLKKLVPDSAE